MAFITYPIICPKNKKLKESSGDGEMTITGVRWAESANRKMSQGIVTVSNAGKRKNKDLHESKDFAETKWGGIVLVNDNVESRRMVESCYKRNKTTLNPIIDWTDFDVWEYIKRNNIPYCKLYDEGFKRLGCIGCPLAKQHGRERELLRWPKYRKLYIKAFEKMLEERENQGKQSAWQRGEDVMRWWLGYDTLPGQIDLLEDYDD